MEDSRLLYKYPCGCKGLGKPHKARPPKGDLERDKVWDDVLVVWSCDSSWEDSGWHLPAARLLIGGVGEHPVPLGEEDEELFFRFMRNLCVDAAKWRQTANVIKLIKKEVSNVE